MIHNVTRMYQAPSLPIKLLTWGSTVGAHLRRRPYFCPGHEDLQGYHLQPRIQHKISERYPPNFSTTQKKYEVGYYVSMVVSNYYFRLYL